MSPNNVSRGQLRPHFAGRSPPFLVVGLCLGLFILGFSYWSLSSQFKELAMQYEEVKNQYQINSQKRETAEKQNDLLLSKLQAQNEKVGKMQTSMDKKEQEISQLSQQLRTKDEEVTKVNAELQKMKEELDNRIKTNDEKDAQINDLKDQLGEAANQNVKLESMQKEKEIVISKLKGEIDLLKQQLKKQSQIASNKVLDKPALRKDKDELLRGKIQESNDVADKTKEGEVGQHRNEPPTSIQTLIKTN